MAGTLEPATIKRLTSGIELDDGFARAVRARLIDSDKVSSTLKLVVTEGRKREVRLLSAVGHQDDASTQNSLQSIGTWGP